MFALPLNLAMLLLAEFLATTPFRITLILPALPPILFALLNGARIAPLRLDAQARRLDNNLSMRQRGGTHNCKCRQANTDFHVRSSDPFTAT